MEFAIVDIETTGNYSGQHRITEIAIYMTAEIEDALADICNNNEKRVNSRLRQLQASRKN